ncbi:eCIS core domain-containing protein [Haloferax elongans]|uniref:eCIS core domain-containing protein n=1 Tax=Haloferax elongans TaxID=403191 RepID=UPI0030845C3C
MSTRDSGMDPQERENELSIRRSTVAAYQDGPAGETATPESVRNVLSSPCQSLDTSIQRAVEDRIGDNLGDVRIHTGPSAAKACEDINARAFTVGNHVAFYSGEYDPSSPEGQHVLAHELAHVRQQTGGAVSMLPQPGQLEVDPDERLEREAEETAQQVMAGGELGIQRLADTEVHIPRIDKTRRDLLEGDVSLDEAATGLAEADLNPVDVDIESERLRDAYKYAEHLATAGTTTGIAQTVATECNLSQPEAIAVTLAVGGTIHVGKDRLHRNDYYVIYEVGKTLGIQDQVLAFFDKMDADIRPETELEGKASSREE